MSEETHYINTDLCLRSTEDLKVLADTFEALNLFLIQCDEHEGEFRVVLETDTQHSEPEKTITDLLARIDSLAGQALRLWQGCHYRAMDIGFQGGVEPFAFKQLISPTTLQCMAQVGMRLMITIYRYDPGTATPKD